MFSGIIQSLGRVTGLSSSSLEIQASHLRTKSGESVCVSGICLTVTRVRDGRIYFGISRETFSRTTLKKIERGDWVNLEPALRVGEAVGGHWVSGHVDDVGRILSILRCGSGKLYRFSAPRRLLPEIARKGSVAVDGVSLTVVEAKENSFTSAIIPYTKNHTTLGKNNPGDFVNIETDILAKYVRRIFHR